MRLTLRTLIAWLDDTLTPSEVKTIGHQVAESPFAKELVERLQRVTRQRRLTYPGDLGSEPTDPNLVAGYLDNELTPELVADFERRCLTSDVHLAEVASVHQVLSLIGQKAKVPEDARLRMYRLVRGRETTKPEAPPVNPPETNARPKPAPVTTRPAVVEPISAWSNGLPTRRPAIERFGPALGVLATIALLVWAAVYSLNSSTTPDPLALHRENGPAPIPVENKTPEVEKKKKPEIPAVPVEPMPKAEEPKPAEVVNPGDVGRFEAISGVVLKANAEGNAWDRVEPKAGLKARARLLNLAPFRNTLLFGKDEVDLVDSTDLILDDPEKDQNSRLELKRGQIVVRTAPGSPPFALRFEGKILEIPGGSGVVVGVERNPTLVPGLAEPYPDRLRIYLPDGHVDFKSGDEHMAIDGPSEISLQASGKFGEKSRKPMPGWVTETAPSGFNKEVGNQFLALLRPGRPILSDLVEAMDDPQKDVKRMAVYALGSIGSMEQVVEVASRKEDPAVHRACLDVLKTGLAMGGDTAKAVHDAIVRQYEQPWADITQQLIIGYRPEDAKDDAILIKLVEYLSAAPTRGTRQLALDNLRALTGRGDTLEYDPDAPEGKGLKAWQDLIRKKDTGKDARSGAPGNR